MSQIPKIQEQIRKYFLENNITNHQLTVPSDWITIQEPSFIKLILESYADEDKKMIMDSVLDKSRTVLEIMDITKIPRTSGYRKINSLIDDGLLISQDGAQISDIKNGKKYKSVFENITISIEQNSVIIKILLSQEALGMYSVIETAKW